MLDHCVFRGQKIDIEVRDEMLPFDGRQTLEKANRKSTHEPSKMIY